MLSIGLSIVGLCLRRPRDASYGNFLTEDGFNLAAEDGTILRLEQR